MRHESPNPVRAINARGALLSGAMAAILASACCLGPLVLITLGVSGAWIANLTALEPYSPVFIGIAAVSLFLAWRRIWRPRSQCGPDQACATPRVRRAYKALFFAVAGLALTPFIFPLLAPWFY
ncbi:mercuric ion transporter MerT [Hahella aquimaris]|uniref:mercuric ion transporter MerT n=1 Tax=Hahella sp. HNIBRBA332 TaxID=3015983 RepID=UPI00273B9E93|nr:mercuric ion transporter MerT [Hahella sp. HNIBRBA332]WLQ13293.1 mercuric ion transporter MerT [Hahella sp. HNIBRBA332]